MPLQVLYEDNHLLAVVKPPGIPTQGAAANCDSLVSQAKEYLKKKYRKPGNVYLGVVSRLDQPVSGVVVFARTSKAASRLNEQFRSRTVEKIYWAMVEGRVTPPSGECVDWVARHHRQRRMVIASASKSDSDKTAAPQQARLFYQVLKHSAGLSWLEIRLETGRKHQIRLQLSARGHPILGDRKYGSKRSFPDGIALHCRRLVIEHPVKKTPLELVVEAPKTWKVIMI